MSYVLITGASAGIGTEFAKQLAAGGNDLILVARREDRLNAIAENLRSQYKVDVKTMAVDLSDVGAITGMAAALKSNDTQLHGLVNNAGYGTPGDFLDGDLNRQVGMIQLNVIGLMAATHALVPLFTDEGERFVINVASVAAFMTIPGFAVYAASKAAVLSFSDAMVAELGDQGIKVSALCPGPTTSEFVVAGEFPDRLVEKTDWMPTDVVVAKSLSNLDKAVVLPGFKNWFQNRMLHIMPRTMVRNAANKMRKKIQRHLK